MGTPWGHEAAALAERLLRDVEEGRAISRRDTVVLAWAVLESEVVRAAEGVLEADDGMLAARVVALGDLILSVAAARSTKASDRAP